MIVIIAFEAKFAPSLLSHGCVRKVVFHEVLWLQWGGIRRASQLEEARYRASASVPSGASDRLNFRF